MKTIVPIRTKKNALMLLTFMVCNMIAVSQTYTSIANGNWNNPNTWENASIPPSGTIPATAVIKINHVVYYTGTSLENYGAIRIVNTTGLNPELVVPSNVTFKNYITGKLYIKDGLYTQYRFAGGGNSGTAQNGSFINAGGNVQILNSIVEVAQDWQNNGGSSSFKNGSLTIGENYYTSSATAFDTLSGVSLSLGWHGTGEFWATSSFNNFQSLRVQLAGTSGNFKVTGGSTVSGDIDYITFKNHVSGIVAGGNIQFTGGVIVLGSLNLDAYCAISASNYDPKGKVIGTQTLNCSLNYFPANYTIATTAVLANGLQFTNPVLLSGTDLQAGALYSFQGVAPGIDATVRIDSLINGAKVMKIDDNAAGVGYANAFQPAVKSGNVTGRSYAVFTFNFYQANTTSPFPLQIVKASALDIDGNAALKEYADIKMGAGATAIYMNNTASDISITSLGGGTFRGQNVLGIERSGIDTAAYANMLTASNHDISSFSINYGTVTSASSGNNQERQFSLYLKGFTYPNQGVLPVKLISFDAVAVDKMVLLKWNTENEFNNHHFEVERSFDMNNYSTVGLVLDGFSTSGTGKSYQYKDNSTELQGRSIVYYRLKQIDIDGKVTYSKVLAVRLQAKTDVVMQVSPNPFVENVNVRFNATENSTAVIRISNLAGQTMLSKQAIISKGFNNIQVDGLNRLASGMYMAQLILNGTVIDNQKLIKN